MTSLTITRGLPASGKSTWAKQMARWYDFVLVNRDSIRQQAFGLDGKGVLSPKQENEVTKLEVALVEAALNAGRSVVVDATHLRQKYAIQWADLAEKHGVDFAVEDFKVDVEECIRRNQERPSRERVPDDVIRNMAKRFPVHSWPEIKPSGLYSKEPPITPYIPDTTKPDAYIFDVDGTLAQIGARNPYDASSAMKDTPIPHVKRMWQVLAHDELQPELLVLTGRKHHHRGVTKEWLNTNGFGSYSGLWTRADGDNRPDHVVKAEIFDKYIRENYNVLGVFDDRRSVCDMWYKMGVPLFAVGDPSAVF